MIPARLLCCLLEGLAELLEVESAAAVLVPAVEEGVGLGGARIQRERAQVVAELALEELTARAR